MAMAGVARICLSVSVSVSFHVSLISFSEEHVVSDALQVSVNVSIII